MQTNNMVFVFGSNTGGIHGGGAARFAYEKKKARWGAGYGHYGDSFAIPTKGHKGNAVGQTLSLEDIKKFVTGFLAYAKHHPELEFQVTCIGCGLAGLEHKDIAPMFAEAPDNCFFDTLWGELLWNKRARQFWGTF